MHSTAELLKRFFCEEWKTLLLVNILAAVFSLPLITAGPALLAMNGVLIRLADGRCGISRWEEFWSVFKGKFWRGIQLEALAGLYLLAMLWSVALADNLEGTGRAAVWLFLSLSLFLAATASVYLVPLLADSRIPFFQALWDAVFLAAARLPRSILAAAAVYGLAYGFLLLYPISVLPYAMFAAAAAAAVSTAVVWPAIDKLIFSES